MINLHRCGLHHGDCLDVLQTIPDNSIDMVLADPPYGMTRNKWDTAIPFEPLWIQLKRITKNTSPIVLFAQQPFTTKLIHSNIKMFKYTWVWDKRITTGFLNAKKQPLRQTEDICIFYNKQCIYNPIMTKGKLANKTSGRPTSNYNNFKSIRTVNDTYYPKQIISILNKRQLGHPTSKPVELMEYLIKTYTNENHVVLDFCMGGGSTGTACNNLNRYFIGIENDPHYFDMAKKRLTTTDKRECNEQ